MDDDGARNSIGPLRFGDDWSQTGSSLAEDKSIVAKLVFNRPVTAHVQVERDSAKRKDQGFLNNNITAKKALRVPVKICVV